MPSDEFEKYLNSQSPEDKEKTANLGNDLQAQGVEAPKEADTNLKAPDETINDKAKGFSTDIGDNSTKAETSIDALSPEAKADATKEAHQLDKSGVEPPKDESKPLDDKGRDNAFTKLDNSASPEQPSEPSKETTSPAPEQAKPQQETGRDNAFTQLGDTTSKDQAQQPPEQDKER